MNPSSAPATIWDEKCIKALLGMRGHPLRRIQAEPWQTWIRQHGGLNRLRQALRVLPLSPNQRALLDLILEYPDSSSAFYAGQLNISQSNYFLHLNNLIQILSMELEDLKPEAPERFGGSALLTNLPAPMTSLIGAQERVAGVVAILERPGVRLLTLTGPGGVGKTRLAIAVGRYLLESYRDGVFFVPLETLDDPTLLATQIARSLAIETLGTQALAEALRAYLRERQILLVLDNFEQLVQSGPMVTDLLQAAGHLKVLVTSRQPLNVYGENRFSVPELSWPNPDDLPPLDELNRWSAVDLFVQRIQEHHPTFVLTDANKEAVVRICHRLDGLPLAIELAAAQVKWLAPDQVLPHLERGLKSLKDTIRDKSLRQKTLWDAIDWSYQLLAGPEKVLFRQLAVFGREWSVEAAQAVCQASDLLDGLDGLVEKSLVRYVGQGAGGGLRFQMLQVVREYALDRLATNTELDEMQRRHAAYFLDLVEQAALDYGRSNQIDWMQRISQELENLQIALQWMLDAVETEMAFRMLGAAWRFYDMLNLCSETRVWMERALAQGPHLKSAGRVKTLWGAGWLAANQGDYAQARIYAEAGLALAREVGDPLLVGLLLQNVANGLCRRKEYAQAMGLLEESLLIFRELQVQEEIAWVLARIAWMFWQSNDRTRSKELFQESLAIFRAMGHQWAIATILRQLGELALDEEDDELAATVLEESLEIARRMGTKQRISEIRREQALLHWRQGHFEEVRIALDESLAISRQIGDQMGLGWTINFQGRLALQQSSILQAKELFEEAQAIFQKIGDESSLSDNLKWLERLALSENR